jgi:LysM repeat protein
VTTINSHANKIRHLTRALIISGGLNVIVLAFLLYWVVRERVPLPYCEYKPAGHEDQQAPLADERTSSQVILSFKNLSFDQLVSRLEETQQIENGFTQRDLALAALVSFYHFDLQRALAGFPQPNQQRGFVSTLSKKEKVVKWIIYPGLSNEQFAAIIHFAKTEQWPLTSQGLFILLQKNKDHILTHDGYKSISEAFFLTREFLAVEMLFHRAQSSVSKQELLSVIQEGSWKLLTEFFQQQRASHDLSEARRQRFLLDYVKYSSSTAAYLLLKSDGEFAAKKLNDTDALAVLSLLPLKTAESEKFALELLTSPRSGAVWKHSAARLYEYSAEDVPSVWNHQNALKRFAPHRLVAQNLNNAIKKVQLQQTITAVPPKKALAIASTPPKKTPPIPSVQPKKVVTAPQPVKERVYIIQEGDSLWKISRQFKVSIDALKAKNQLKSDKLKPGITLKIPS